MSSQQRLVVVVAFVTIGIILGLIFLRWSDGWGYDLTPIVIVQDNSMGAGIHERWGLYARFGLAGVLLGLVGPPCLFAIAIFVAIGAEKSP